jgi:NADP-dependent 3-hydroxy acid dehydrogenase YdfG
MSGARTGISRGVSSRRARDRADVKAFAEFARQAFGRVDVIFNNAGVMPVSPMNALKTDEWDRIIDIIVRSVRSAGHAF